MERLTKKQNPVDLLGDGTICNYGVPNHYEYHTATAIANKLGELEDLEEELDMPLDKTIDLLFRAIKNSEFYDCLTCTNVMHNERGCDGNCSHNREFSRKEILELLELEEEFRGK